MAYVLPFRALRYDPARVTLSQVVTQPYDKINSDMQERYHAASPYNLVRIILGKQQPTDHEGDDVYSRAAASFRDWRRQGVFFQDSQPAIYSYIQRFLPPGGGNPVERRGFIALGRIEDYSADVVFRHEQTLAKPKADRLNLLRATRAHFGQIFMLYSDPAGEIEAALSVASPPDIDVVDEYQVSHRVWKVSEPGLIELIRVKMRDKKLIIADGHHRYETALNYRNERRGSASSQPGMPRERSQSTVAQSRTDEQNAPYDLVMMTFVNLDAPGLVILPTHRVVFGLASFSPALFREAAGNYFSVEDVDPSIDAARAAAILRRAGQTGTAMLAITADRAFLLDRPKPSVPNLLSDLSLRQQSLDVVQLHRCILEDVLKISPDAIREQKNVRYLRDMDEALAQVRTGQADVAFLINPVRVQQVRDIAFAGEVLPQKSTDFYPKLLSGLTIYALE